MSATPWRSSRIGLSLLIRVPPQNGWIFSRPFEAASTCFIQAMSARLNG